MKMRRKKPLPSWSPSRNFPTYLKAKRSWFPLLRKYTWLFAAFFAFGLLVSFLFLKWELVQYVSVVNLELVASPTSALGTEKKTYSVSAEEAKTHVLKITSGTLTERVAKIIQLNPNLYRRFIETADRRALRKGFDLYDLLKNGLSSSHKDAVLTINYTHPDPIIAATVTDIYGLEYEKYQSESMSSTSKVEIESLKSQEERLQLSLKLNEKNLNELDSQNPSLSLSLDHDVDEETRLSHLNQVVLLEKKVSELELQLSQVLPLVNNLEGLRKISFLSTSSSVVKLTENDNALKVELSRLSVVYGKKHPKILDIVSKIEENNGLLKEALASAIIGLEASWREAKTNLDVARERLRNHTEQLAKNKRLRQEYDDIKSNILRERNLLNLTQQKISNLGVTQDKGFSSVKLVSLTNGYAEKKQISPWIVFSAGLFGSLLLSAAAFVIISYSAKSFSSEESTGDFYGIPILSHIKNYPPKKMSSASGVIFEGRDLFKNDFDKLNSSIVLSLSGKTPRIFVVASSVGGEGRTFVAANVALNFATKGEKILFVDCDFRHSNLFTKSNFVRTNGLLSYITNKDLPLENIIRKTDIPNFDVVHSGGVTDHATQRLTSDRFKVFLKDVSKQYDRIIIDTPPVAIYGDANLVISLSDAVLFVAAEGRVESETLHSMLKKLTLSNVAIIGIVVNFSTNESCVLPKIFHFQIRW